MTLPETEFPLEEVVPRQPYLSQSKPLMMLPISRFSLIPPVLISPMMPMETLPAKLMPVGQPFTHGMAETGW